MKLIPNCVLVLLALMAAGCVAPASVAEPPSSSKATASPPPLLGKVDSTDQADRSCQVVLRQVQREGTDGSYETDCSSSSCVYVWRGSIDVAETVAPEATVHVLYRLGAGTTWWEVAASYQPAVMVGYRRYTFSMSEHLFGSDMTASEQQSIDLVAFVRLPGGGRLFDHNRFTNELQNHVLVAEDGFSSDDAGVCQPVVGTVSFHDNWEESTWGIRRQGGYLRVNYDIDRLDDCRGTHNGFPAWDVVAHAKFLPGGQLFSGSVREFIDHQGVPTNQGVDHPYLVKIPDDAEAVQLWFMNYTGAGSSCQAWDSNEGANYHFDVWPTADDPRCRDVEKETGAVTEDHRMVHNAPYCLAYEVEEQFDAAPCEFYLNEFGWGHMGHYGLPTDWLVAYLQVSPQDDEVLGVGMYTRFRDSTTGELGQRFSLGIQVARDVWKTGFSYHVTEIQGVEGYAYEVDEFAFFVDLRRPSGQVVRMWKSRYGANYSWDDAFSLPTSTEYIPYGNIQWANPGAEIFDSQHDCP